ncbi:MAG: 2-succinyl-5-enolpyruvyl-6-hydroxy-3-cyclohexene-1-carboxylic-acid synthase, partial [Actinomycetota bacterium]
MAGDHDDASGSGAVAPEDVQATFCATLVDRWIELGVRHAVVAPGSRSTPLAVAVTEREELATHVVHDERVAAFVALGVGVDHGVPALLICTSGTAAANFFPAIIEANMSRVPLLVLTADRPHELRHSGANQTIDQVKMYGDHVLWSVDMALPEHNPPEVAVRNLRTMAARALATADGRMEFRRKGVVHLNFPFRKPLEPEIPEKSSNEPVDSSEYASVVFD